MNFIAQYPNILTKDLCEGIIEKFNTEFSKGNTEQEYSAEGTTINHTASEWSEICQGIIELTEKKVQDYISPVVRLCPHKYTFRSLSMLRYAAGQHVPLHYDEEIAPDGTGKHFICLIYLRSILLGGELLFPFQKEVIKPEAGLMVIFPTFFTHPHSVLPTVDEERYCLRIHYKISDRVLYAEGKPYAGAKA